MGTALVYNVHEKKYYNNFHLLSFITKKFLFLKIKVFDIKFVTVK